MFTFFTKRTKLLFVLAQLLRFYVFPQILSTRQGIFSEHFGLTLLCTENLVPFLSVSLALFFFLSPALFMDSLPLLKYGSGLDQNTRIPNPHYIPAGRIYTLIRTKSFSLCCSFKDAEETIHD